MVPGSRWQALGVVNEMRKAKDIPRDARNALKDRISYFRGMAYGQLAMEMEEHEGDHLEITEFKSQSGEEFQLVIDCCYDGKPGGPIRVDGSILEIPLRPLLGLLPIYLSRSCEGFILTREGTFLDEDGDAAETIQAEPGIPPNDR